MAEKTDDKNKIESEDLDLVDDALEDDGKDESALWQELEQAEAGAAATEDPDAAASPGDEPGDDTGDGTDAAAADDAGKQGDSAASRDPGADGASGDGGKKSDGGKPSDGANGKTQENDVWANATPEHRAAYDAAQSKWEDRDRRLRGQISALQRQVNDISRTPTKAAPANGAASKGSGKGDDGADGFMASSDWKSFEQEYPEVAGPLAKVIGGMQAQITNQTKELSAIGSDRREQAMDEQYDLLVDAHPDWEQVTDDPTFGTWLNEQPRHIREAAIRNAREIVDAEEAADVIGRFKSQSHGAGDAQNGSPAGDGGGKRTTQELSGKRKRQLESATTARTRSPTGTASGIPEDGDPETMWKQMDEQERREARA